MHKSTQSLPLLTVYLTGLVFLHLSTDIGMPLVKNNVSQQSIQMLNSVDPQTSMEKCVAGTECIAFAIKQFFFSCENLQAIQIYIR